jgi:AcrR family transcriptional regulator
MSPSPGVALRLEYDQLLAFYQYYPNKAALLFHLHQQEMQETWQGIEEILDDPSRRPGRR